MQEWSIQHPYLTFSLISLFMFLVSGTIREIFGKPIKNIKTDTKKADFEVATTVSQVSSEDTTLN
jgi:hypothetical protein